MTQSRSTARHALTLLLVGFACLCGTVFGEQNAAVTGPPGLTDTFYIYASGAPVVSLALTLDASAEHERSIRSAALAALVHTPNVCSHPTLATDKAPSVPSIGVGVSFATQGGTLGASRATA